MKIKLLILSFIAIGTTAFGQLTAISYNNISLNTNVDMIPNAKPLIGSLEERLFMARPADHYYLLPTNNVFDTTGIKYIVAFTNEQHLIKKLILIFDGKADSLVSHINLFGLRHTTMQSSIGSPFGNVIHGWSTKEGTTIILSKTDKIDRTLNFKPTILEMHYKVDYPTVSESSFSTEIL